MATPASSLAQANLRSSITPDQAVSHLGLKPGLIDSRRAIHSTVNDCVSKLTNSGLTGEHTPPTPANILDPKDQIGFRL